VSAKAAFFLAMAAITSVGAARCFVNADSFGAVLLGFVVWDLGFFLAALRSRGSAVPS
jgi:hypothetical protein